MPGPLSMRPHRAKGSWIPRLIGVAVVVVVAGGGLVTYLGSAGRAVPASQHHVVLSAKVLKVQTIGLIDFGPDNDADAFTNDPDDHPLMLAPAGKGVNFVPISAADLAAGAPVWTANQMADGSEIFIYIPTGQCLSAAGAARRLLLAHCDLALSQRWLPVHPSTALGQPFAQYQNAMAGRCLTAPAAPGPATLTACADPARMDPADVKRHKSQEIAFWWGP